MTLLHLNRPPQQIANTEAERVRNLSDDELHKYIDANPISSPERAHALQVRADRDQAKAHRLASRSVKWTIFGVVVAVLALVIPYAGAIGDFLLSIFNV